MLMLVPFTDAESLLIMRDPSKRIEQDIRWQEDEDHSPALEFMVEVENDLGCPLRLMGRFNREVGSLSYTVIHRGAGRIYALDLGKDHHNPQCTCVGEKHKHTWSEAFRDKEAYVPADITADVSSPVGVWRQFCKEASIRHDYGMEDPVGLLP